MPLVKEVAYISSLFKSFSQVSSLNVSIVIELQHELVLKINLFFNLSLVVPIKFFLIKSLGCTSYLESRGDSNVWLLTVRRASLNPGDSYCWMNPLYAGADEHTTVNGLVGCVPQVQCPIFFLRS